MQDSRIIGAINKEVSSILAEEKAAAEERSIQSLNKVILTILENSDVGEVLAQRFVDLSNRAHRLGINAANSEAIEDKPSDWESSNWRPFTIQEFLSTEKL